VGCIRRILYGLLLGFSFSDFFFSRMNQTSRVNENKKHFMVFSSIIAASDEAEACYEKKSNPQLLSKEAV